MMTPFFLYNYTIEEKNKFLEQVVGNTDDLMFVFEVNSNKVIFHNYRFSPLSNWDSILTSADIFDAIKSKLSHNDFPALMQLSQKLYIITDRDFIVRELHILNKVNVYGHYQVEISLFEKIAGQPVQFMCRVHTLQDQTKVKDLFVGTNGFAKIILIDDDELTNVLNTKIINSVLPDAQVEVFLDVDEALDWIKINDKKGDLLLFLDINFPRRSGWDFMEEYSVLPVQSKVIMLSSSIVNADRTRALAYKNVVQYMSKPLSFDFLETVLK
jgi:CheY-like chemotaxis protein